MEPRFRDVVCQCLAETLPVPVISFGAGNKADGVHIITSDLPRRGEPPLPGREHTVFLKEDELKRFRDLVNWHA